jgi:hypothetical protein
MQKPILSVARLMADIAMVAVGLTAFRAVCSRRDDPGVGVLCMVLAVVTTVATDRALFGRRHRPFWLGFAAAGWLCAAMALFHVQDTRRYLLKYGPPVARARQDRQMQLILAQQAKLQGVALVTPPVSEWYLLCSLFVEVILGLFLGALVALAGGFFAAAVAVIARQADHLANRSHRITAHGGDAQ